MRTQTGLLALLLALALPAHADEGHERRPGYHDGWVTPADYYTFACMREYGRLHGIPDFDASMSYAQTQLQFGAHSGTLMRLDEAAREYAGSLRAPDHSQQEDRGLAPVLMLCQHQARSKRVTVLGRAPGSQPQFCDADLVDLPALRMQIAQRWPDGAAAAKVADAARAWMGGELRKQAVADPLRGGRRATLWVLERECGDAPLDERLNWRLALLADAQGRVYARELSALLPDPRRFEFREAPPRLEYFDTPLALQQAMDGLTSARMSADLVEQRTAALRDACARGDCGGRLDVSGDAQRTVWRYTPDPRQSIAARLAGTAAVRTITWSFDAEGFLEEMEVH